MTIFFITLLTILIIVMCYCFLSAYWIEKEMEKEFARIEKMQKDWESDKPKIIGTYLDDPEIRKEIENLLTQLHNLKKQI
jgi:hypothetical protein